MIKKYIIVVLFYTIICLLFIVVKAECRENRYTISGEYSYQEVFNLLGMKTNRSVLGSSELLTLKRNFFIYDKEFHIAVDHVSKNLLQDGYVLYTDSSCFYVQPFKIPEKIDTKKVYKIYLPYSKMYLVTENEQEYLNALQKDKEKYINDSINLHNNSKVYKIELEIMGFTDDKKYVKGIDINDNVSLTISKELLNTVINMNLGLIYTNYKINNDYNFYRNVVTYTSDDTLDLLFGSEERRLLTKITNDKVITDSYESIYNGLNIKIKGNSYDLKYKVMNDQINLVGYKDSVSYCQANVKSRVHTNRYRFVNSSSGSESIFYIYVLFKKYEISP